MITTDVLILINEHPQYIVKMIVYWELLYNWYLILQALL